jgi:hypothetical protein
MGGSSKEPSEKVHPEERELAAIAREQWDEYKTKYVPIENEWMERVEKLNDPLEHAQARGLASTEFNQANREALTDRQGAMGAGAGVRRGGDMLAMTGRANNAGQISNRASLGVTDRYVRGMENIVGIGQGQATEGLQGMSDLAEQAVQGRIDSSKNRFEREQGKRNMVGALAGGASRYGLGKITNTDK